MPDLALAKPPADIYYEEADEAGPSGRSIRRFLAQDRVWLDVQSIPGGLRFEFPDLASFTFDRKARKYLGYSMPGTASHTMRHLLLDQVVPLSLVAQGRMILHASGVRLVTAHGSSATIFLGKSGAGKSSVAAGSTLAGADVLADDFVLVNAQSRSATVTPAGVGLRVHADVARLLDGVSASLSVAQYTEKRRLLLAPESAGRRSPVRLGAIVGLAPRSSPGTPVQARRLSPADALMLVLEHAYRIDVRKARAHRGDLDRYARLVEAVPAFEMSLPADVPGLVRSCEQVLSLLRPHLSSAPVAPS